MNRKYKNPFTFKNAIIYFIIIFIIFFAVSLTVFSYNEYIKVQAKMEEIKFKENIIVDAASNRLGGEIVTILSDLSFLKQQYKLYQKAGNSVDMLAEEWRIFSEKRGIYDQVRFIDNKGNEKIRINNLNETSYIVENSELQNKKERYYFTDTIKLNDNQTYISKIDLNVENKEIELPIKPMIRLCTPVYDENNQLVGIVVLNYLAENMIDKFKPYLEGSNGKMFLVNSNGYWIYSGNPDDDWGFMYEEKKDISFKNSYNEEWNTISNEEGSLMTDNGYFEFANAILNDEIKHDSILNPSNVVLGDGDIKVVSYVDGSGEYGYLFEKPYNIETIKKVIKDNSIYFIFMAIISLFCSYLIYLRKKSSFDIKYFSEYDGLTNALNRRAGFDLLNKKLVGKDNKSKISLCFIDINGLKVVNDTLGHEEGDRLILTIVDTIKKEIRDTDFIIRMGGDEFLIVFNNLSVEQSEGVWIRILEKLDIINENEDRAYIVSASHGIVELDKSKRNLLDEFIEEADKIMYMEKREIKKNLVIIREK